jgi:signal transduction histidine kinase
MLVLHGLVPGLGIRDVVLVGLVPLLLLGIVNYHSLRNASARRDALIREQIAYVESRHEELREAYLEQEQTRVQLRRKIVQLTALHRAGLLFSSTFDRHALLEHVLQALTGDLHYDRAMVSFFDPGCRVLEHVRITGVSAEVQAFAASCRIPVTDPESPEGIVVLQGRPLLIEDIRTVAEQLHPLNQTLVELSRTKTLIIVPLKTKDRILGALTVDRAQAGSLTTDDLELMSTLGSQVAIALDNAAAYQQIEEWNMGLELKVRERTAELEKADRLRAQFLSHVSHELKTPLTSIKGFLQNLLDGLTGPLNEKQQQYVSRMLDNADRLIRMITDLLDRTSIEAGRLHLSPVEVDVQACLLEAVEQLRPLAHAKGQEVELRQEPHALHVWADRDRLIQILVNLIQNAVKYTPECGRIIVSAEEAEEGRMGRIVIGDTGPGVPEDCLDKVFDPFFRVQQGQRNGPMGLGLGLSIVKTLVESQGGRVGVCTRPEGGAEFSFTLPVLAHIGRPEVSSGAGRILVVDDDPDIRQLIQDRLQGQGYQVAAAADDRQALDALSEGEWRGAIVDIGLGTVDGLDLLRLVRSRYPTLPIVMITASGSQDAAVRAIGMGAQAYLLKPFEADELQRVVHTLFSAGSPP